MKKDKASNIQAGICCAAEAVDMIYSTDQKYHAEYPTILSAQASTCAEVVSK